jgi:hypothetical protein
MAMFGLTAGRHNQNVPVRRAEKRVFGTDFGTWQQ